MPRLRPAQSPPKPPRNLTPALVREHGWRDERYHGVDQCGRCCGWGTVARTEGAGDSVRRVLQTCAACLGKGGHK